MQKENQPISDKFSTAAGGCLCNCSSYEEHLQKINRVREKKFIKAHRFLPKH